MTLMDLLGLAGAGAGAAGALSVTGAGAAGVTGAGAGAGVAVVGAGTGVAATLSGIIGIMVEMACGREDAESTLGRAGAGVSWS